MLDGPLWVVHTTWGLHLQGLLGGLSALSRLTSILREENNSAAKTPELGKIQSLIKQENCPG